MLEQHRGASLAAVEAVGIGLAEQAVIGRRRPGAARKVDRPPAGTAGSIRSRPSASRPRKVSWVASEMRQVKEGASTRRSSGMRSVCCCASRATPTRRPATVPASLSGPVRSNCSCLRWLCRTQADFAGALELWALADQIEHAAGTAGAIEHRGGPAQQLGALHGVDLRARHQAGADLPGHAVEKGHRERSRAIEPSLAVSRP